MTFPGLTAVYLIAATVAAITAALMWRYGETPGARPLALMIVMTSAWALLDAVELQVGSVAGKRLVSQLQYVAVVCVPPFFLRAALGLSRLGHRGRSPLVRLAVWGVPAATLTAAWTSRWHGWLWRDIAIPDPATNLAVYAYGPWFWVHTAHAYLLMATGTVVLLATVARVRRPFRAPILAVVGAVLLAWLGNAAYVFKLGPWPGLNWLSVSLVASGGLLAWGALQGGLFDLLPRAREVLADELADPVIVLDLEGRVAFANRAAGAVLDLRGSEARRIGDRASGGSGAPLPEALLPASEAPEDPAPWRDELLLEGRDGTRCFDARGRPVLDRWGEVAGQVLLLRDVTERREMEAAREALIADLESALGRVRTLEGMLPICAGCRKIRDDEGLWQRIEQYLGERMPVLFTHALCPDCEEELYPELAGDPGGGSGDREGGQSG